MDPNKLVEFLRCTLQPNLREEAEKQLDEMRKIIGFAPILLQAVMSPELDMPVRQAGVIYLKNMTNQYWEEREPEKPGEVVPFSIHEQDKQIIRNNVVEAIIQNPDPIRVQLAVCVSHIVKHDYPGKWPGIATKVHDYLSFNVNIPETVMGALLCLYQLVKNFEYKKAEDRATLNEALRVLLPMIHQRCAMLVDDQSEQSVRIQKQILKIFYSLIQFVLSLDLITKEVFTQWMHLIQQIVEKPVPESTNDVDFEERPFLVWWKCKKWAVHIWERTFERYGSPGNVMKDYHDFAEWYLKTFTGNVLRTLFNILENYHKKVYVSPRVLQLSIKYLEQGVSHGHSWKFMKQYVMGVIKEIVFPLMCHNDEDEELWQSDPVEFIRSKYDIYDEIFSPVLAAQGFLCAAISKRKEVLQNTMGFLVEIMGSPDLQPRHKDGALHILGSVADILLQKKIYKDKVEPMLSINVYPEFQSPFGFLRARACWLLKQFCDVKFKKAESLPKCLELLLLAMAKDKDLPVKVEAALALQSILTKQEKAVEYLKPHVNDIIIETLKIMRESENDDLTNFLQKMVCTYTDEILPLAIQICTELATTFASVINTENEEEKEDKAILAMGILNTLDTIVTVLEDKKDVIQHLEGIVLQVVALILQKNSIEFFEEMFSLISSLTTESISPNMWSCLPMIHKVFNSDNMDYFTDMMPALHNYVTVDHQTFLSSIEYLNMIYDMCRAVMTGDAGEDAECHACKLLEVVLLEYHGKKNDQVDHHLPVEVVQSFVGLALERLLRPIETSELRTMCLQVVIAALYGNPTGLMETLQAARLPQTNEPLMPQFLKQWLNDVDCFLGLHDRKLCILGLCCLLNTSSNLRPQPIVDVAKELIPAFIMLFKGLQRAYAQKAAEENEDDDDDDDKGDDAEGEELEDEEDDISEKENEYLERLAKGDADEDEDYDEMEDETALEVYETILDKDECTVDECVEFKTLLQNIQQQDPEWYKTLTDHLDEQQRKELGEVFIWADRRKAEAESKKIQQNGGYVFNSMAVPQAFNFGPRQ